MTLLIDDAPDTANTVIPAATASLTNGLQGGTSGGVLGIKRGNLTVVVSQHLLERIESGVYTAGERLPSQEELCQEFGVSRTVIREAVASLRQNGYLVVRQGAGVFVAENQPGLLFGSFAPHDVAAGVHILELRVGVEVESAVLAAQRRTPASLANLTAAYDRFSQLDGSDIEALARADYEFHLAIAQATQNPQFVNFFQALGQDIFLDLKLKYVNAAGLSQVHEWGKHSGRQHAAILSAISIGDAGLAREAIRSHLAEGLDRYRRAASGHLTLVPEET